MNLHFITSWKFYRKFIKTKLKFWGNKEVPGVIIDKGKFRAQAIKRLFLAELIKVLR